MLSHGDLWVNNIFFKKDAEGNLSDEVCAFLDWQVAHAGMGRTSIFVDYRKRICFPSADSESI